MSQQASKERAVVRALVAKLAGVLEAAQPYGSAWEFSDGSKVDGDQAYDELVRHLYALPSWAKQGVILPSL